MDPFELDSIAKLMRAKSGHPWLETVLITAAFFVFGVVVRPDDPLLTSEGFPWSIFAPVLTGLRYGFAHGFVAAVILHVGAGLYALGGDALWPLPFGYTMGLLLSGMVVGEFRDIWDSRIEQLERSNEYRQARLEEFTRSYHVLKISHDELEQEHAGRRTSLRSALLSARERLVGASPERVGEELLNLLEQFMSARTAAYHSVVDGRIVAQPVATLGDGSALSDRDPLVLRALETGATVSIRPEDTHGLAARDQDDPIVVIPVTDAYRTIHAVVGVQQIPFFALTERNLQIASIVAGRFGDFLHALATLPAELDEELYWFLYHALRCVSMADEHGLYSSLLVCRMHDSASAPAYIDTIVNQARGLDQVLPWREGDTWNLLLLLPLTTPQGLERFMHRFDAYLSETHGIGPAQAGIRIFRYIFEPAAGTDRLARFLAESLGQSSELVRSLSMLRPPPVEEARHALAGNH